MEQHGAGEAYLPVLEALGRIGRAPGGEQFVAILHQYAPTWLVQMPALLAAEELETLQRRVVGATRERMLREMVEAIEALDRASPVGVVVRGLALGRCLDRGLVGCGRAPGGTGAAVGHWYVSPVRSEPEWPSPQSREARAGGEGTV